MPVASYSKLVSRVRSVVPSPAPTAADAELLGRYVVGRDAEAFAEIVRRHGPAVFGVCRRVTGHHHLAEDAFQAVFVVLATKAACVRPRSALAGWLYGVAHRTALRARTMNDRRRRHERATAAGRSDCAEATYFDDLAAVLDAEIARLPAGLRQAVVLCELQGRGRKEVATELGIPEGTLSSRLAAARKALAARLRSRGIALSTAGLTAGFAQLGSASVPAVLTSRTAEAAINPALVPVPVAALSNGVIRIMFAQKLKLAAVCLSAAAVLAWSLFAQASPPVQPEPRRTTPVAFEQPKPVPQPAPKAEPLPKGPNKLLLWKRDDLVLIDPDGKNEKAVIGKKEGLHPHMFSFSPDGTKVAIVGIPLDKDAREFGTPHLYVCEVGKDGPPLDLGTAGLAHWSGDSTELAVCLFTDGKEPSDVKATHHIINLKTKETIRVKLPENHLMMDWSLDGKHFLTLKLGKEKDYPFEGIWLMNRDGSENKRVVDGKLPAVFARLSADGKRVLFMEAPEKEETPLEKKARDELGGRKPLRFHVLKVADVATGKITKVEDVPLNAELQGFCWSPDGKRIAYVWREVHEGKFEDLREKETETHLVTCDPDGKNQKTVLSEKGKGQYEMTLGGADWR